jgi:mycothiol synthase
MTEAGVNVVHRSRLDADEVRAVLRLVDDVTDTDGTRPLSEHVMLHLRYGGDSPASNYLAWSGDELAGYAHLDTTDTVEGASAEVAVGPRHRGMGIGKSLVEALLGETGDGSRVRLWAHGQSSGAVELARSMGFRRERVLWQMRRSLYAPVPAPQWPDDVNVRTFVVGQDEEPWLEVNNRAFAAHPDQGTWTLDDLRMRECEPWFDPSGFFLAETDGRLVGFHWTKVHAEDASTGGKVGEVYVLGVDPSAQGLRLGTALLDAGLRHLRDTGLQTVLLYVEESNGPAIHLYARAGFTIFASDIQYALGR